MSEPAHDRGSPPPDALVSSGVARDTLADWITEDVIQQLYASRQDLAEAIDEGADGVGGVGGVADQLLDIISSLHDIATLLRGREAGATRVDDPEERARAVGAGPTAAAACLPPGPHAAPEPDTLPDEEPAGGDRR